MSFGAKEINEKNFTTTLFRGYTIAEVDDFLDLVAAEMEKLQQANNALEEKVRQMEHKLAGTGMNETPIGHETLEDRVEELERRIL